MRIFTLLVAVAGLVVLGATHLGRIWPLADSLAVGRLVLYAVGLLVFIALLIQRQRKMAAVVFASVALSAFITYRDNSGGAIAIPGPLTLYQKNMLWNGETPGEIVRDIRASDADFVTLQEVSSLNRDALAALNGKYPYQASCASQGNGGIMIMSRFPLMTSDLDCSAGSGLIVSQATLADGSQLWVASVHLNWPYPFSQNVQINKIEHGLRQLDGPVVLGGDFNMVAWGASVQRVAEAAESTRVGGYWQTFRGFGDRIPLAIDHVMVPEGWHGVAQIRDPLGSDHNGLLVHFGR